MKLKQLIRLFIPGRILDIRLSVVEHIKFKKYIPMLRKQYGEYTEEINEMFIAKKTIIFPYSDIISKYNCKQIKIQYEDGYPYVMHCLSDGKTYAKLFFPNKMKVRDVKILYNALLVEQDIRSPHCYFDDNHKLESTNILYDIGAAEAIVALTYINTYKKAYIFEGDEEWFVPLEKTFSQYTDKVEIIKKYVSDSDSESSVKLEHYIDSSDGIPFIKMDVEGMEMQILNNIKSIFQNNKCKASICVYHKPNDANDISSYFDEIGYSQRFTPRYTFLDFNDDHPSFRKGVLYAESKA